MFHVKRASADGCPPSASSERFAPRSPAIKIGGHDLKTATTDPGSRREILVVARFDLVGGVLRLWSLGRLGLIHFDEGVYALAGLWCFRRRDCRTRSDGHRLRTAGVSVPGRAVSTWCLGVSDFSAILVSIVAGTLTIPAAAWLARRTFGAGQGGRRRVRRTLGSARRFFADGADRRLVSSCSGCWRSARGSGFSSGPIRHEPSALGLAVGAAQLFKYNGWLSGVIVAPSAAVWLVAPPATSGARGRRPPPGDGASSRRSSRPSSYWPWFQFVESHGGYARTAGPPARLSRRLLDVARPSVRAARPRRARSRAGRSGLRAAASRPRSGCHPAGDLALRRRSPAARSSLVAIGLAAPLPVVPASFRVAVRPRLDLLRAPPRLSSAAKDDVCWESAGQLSGGTDAVLSSLRTALASAPGLQLALPGRVIRRRSVGV